MTTTSHSSGCEWT